MPKYIPFSLFILSICEFFKIVSELKSALLSSFSFPLDLQAVLFGHKSALMKPCHAMLQSSKLCLLNEFFPCFLFFFATQSPKAGISWISWISCPFATCYSSDVDYINKQVWVGCRLFYQFFFFFLFLVKHEKLFWFTWNCFPDFFFLDSR